MMHHTQIAQRVFNTPLMVDPAKALAFLTGLGPRITGREISVEGMAVDPEDQATGWLELIADLEDRLARITTAFADYGVAHPAFVDTAQTLMAMSADAVVIRHGASGAPHVVARHRDGAVGGRPAPDEMIANALTDAAAERVATLEKVIVVKDRIVNIVADMWRGMPGMGHSGAARMGMLSFTETAAVEWAHAGVRVNAVAPGLRIIGCVSRVSALTKSLSAAPLGHSVPRLTGWSASPSMCMTRRLPCCAVRPEPPGRTRGEAQSGRSPSGSGASSSDGAGPASCFSSCGTPVAAAMMSTRGPRRMATETLVKPVLASSSEASSSVRSYACASMRTFSV